MRSLLTMGYLILVRDVVTLGAYQNVPSPLEF